MEIQDGSAKFRVRDERLQVLFDMIHPVGSVYTTIKDGKPFDMGTWEEIGQGRVLQGITTGQTAGTTVEAGLPNITGRFSQNIWTPVNTGLTGAFYGLQQHEDHNVTWDGDNTGEYGGTGFDASRSSAIYGKSNTVQPPAYLVHFWIRKA